MAIYIIENTINRSHKIGACMLESDAYAIGLPRNPYYNIQAARELVGFKLAHRLRR